MDMQIQWYPGHMTKTKRMIAANMGIIDVVIELLDARVPLASRNPDIDSLAGGKKRVLVLNKADLANEKITALWEDFFREQGFFTLPLNSTDNKKNDTNKLVAALKNLMREKVEQQKKRGRINAPIRAMVVGIPNVGKSTFINRLSGRAGATVADRPGVTRGRQWLKVGGEFDLMDTPGVLWPKFDDPLVGLKLACTGAVSDNVFDKITLVTHLLEIFVALDPKILQNRYKVEPDESDMIALLEKIGNARGFKMKGNIIDLERTAITILDEFRGGKLGRVSLESPDASPDAN
ncbi:MAG: ribosome biogenesis GTPase YlqF [Defluviitaleaceae bacterium]|nr:ribosome biogenesis GTPase YlqF [Defluviitaleaceae bacterium]